METIVQMFAVVGAFALLPVFWAVLVGVMLLLSCTVVYEKGMLVTVSTAVLLFLLAAKFPVMLTWVDSPVGILVSLGLYLMIGVTWSTFKWMRFISAEAAEIVAVRSKLVRREGSELSEVDALIQLFRNNGWNRELSVVYDQAKDGKTVTSQEMYRAMAPQSKKHKKSIVLWVTHWPISVLWFILRDLVTELGNAIYKALGGHFQGLSNRKFDQL
jgi:hypothetical protein